MTMNEQAAEDLDKYFRLTVWSAVVLISVIVFGIVAAYALNFGGMLLPLLGSLMGSILAVINLFAIGYCFFALTIKKSRRWVIFLPLSSFLAMCFLAFILANYFPDYILGYALGLAAPITFGATIAFASIKP